MKKIVRTGMLVGVLVGVMALASLATPDVQTAFAVCDPSNPTLSGGADCARGSEQPADLFGDGGIFQRVTNILLFLIGAIAVIMLIIGGIRYVISGGDQGQVTAAKNTILYAIIGIVVAFLAFAAVDFVTSQLKQSTDSEESSYRLPTYS